ncbi:MAG: prepilin-type N-terminal cleavage/methylation domain-containing protein [Brevinematia bacterium]
MSSSKAFSLIEVMVVLMLSSIVFMVIYNLISIGVRFFESFSSRFDFSVSQFVKDVEYEISFSDDFFVTNRVLTVVRSNNIVRYILGKPDSNFSYFVVKKHNVYQKKEKTFYLKEVLDIRWYKEENKFVKKLFVSIIDLKGSIVYEGYVP